MNWNDLKNNAPEAYFENTSTIYKTCIALGKSGVPYAAFQNPTSSPKGKACIAKYESGAWNYPPQYQNISTVTADYIQLKFSKSGDGYLVYKNESTSIIAHRLSLIGTSYIVGPSETVITGDFEKIALALAPDGTPYVAFGAKSLQKYRVRVAFLSGTGWQEVPSIDEVYPRDVTEIAIAVANEGGANVPYVAFSDWEDNVGHRAKVRKYDGMKWNDLLASGYIGNGVNPVSICMVFDTNNVLYIARAQESTTELKWIQIGKFDGTWHDLSTVKRSTQPSLATSSDNTVYLSCIDYLESGKLYVYHSKDNFTGRLNTRLKYEDTTQIDVKGKKVLVARQNFDTFLNKLPLDVWTSRVPYMWPCWKLKIIIENLFWELESRIKDYEVKEYPILILSGALEYLIPHYIENPCDKRLRIPDNFRTKPIIDRTEWPIKIISEEEIDKFINKFESMDEAEIKSTDFSKIISKILSEETDALIKDIKRKFE